MVFSETSKLHATYSLLLHAIICLCVRTPCERWRGTGEDDAGDSIVLPECVRVASSCVLCSCMRRRLVFMHAASSCVHVHVVSLCHVYSCTRCRLVFMCTWCHCAMCARRRCAMCDLHACDGELACLGLKDGEVSEAMKKSERAMMDKWGRTIQFCGLWLTGACCRHWHVLSCFCASCA